MPFPHRLAALVACFAALPCAAQPPARELVPGVTLRVYQLAGDVTQIPTLAPNQTPNTDTVLSTIDLPATAPFPALPAPIVCHVRAFLRAPTAGDYDFRLTSDDGARLFLDGLPTIDHDGQHAADPKSSGPRSLFAGSHELLIEHFDSGGRRTLRLEWRPPGQADFSLIPPDALTTDADNARVTSPGVKTVATDGRPGDGREVEGVHPGFTRTPILPEAFQPKVGAMAFLPDGRLVLGTFDPMQRTDTDLPDIESKTPDKLFALSGVTTGDPAKVTVSTVADGLFEPLGLCAVDDTLYVSHRRAITQLLDRDHDGFFETHGDIASGWEAWNYHQFAFGLVHHDGRLYATLSTAMAPPRWEGMGTNAAPNGPLRGVVLEVDIASRSAHAIAGGCRAPNGIAEGPGGALFYCDNQGTWMPTSQLAEIVPGRFFGHYNNTNFVPNLADRFPSGGVASALCDRPRAPAAIFFPQNELANSPSQPLLIENGPYAGQMLVGEITAGGIRRVFLEKVNGVWQGAAFRFTQGLSCGVNRLAWGPDGALYAGGIGASGNWSWNDTRFGLDRLVPSGKTAFEILAVRATPEGFELEFTRPINPAWLADPANFQVAQWRYLPTADYGGPKIDDRFLAVSTATPAPTATKVRLAIPGLETGSCIRIRTDPVSTDGEQIWSTEAWYTLNQIPTRDPVSPARLAGKPIHFGGLGLGQLPPADGVVLIGRRAANAMHNPAKPTDHTTQGITQAQIIAGPEYVEVGKGSGDLVSRTSFGDCRLHVEWLSPPGGKGQMAGNSGVYIQERYEVQVLGTPAGDGPLQPNEAGAIYNVKAPGVNASNGPGRWQAYDIWFHAPRFVGGVKTESARLTVYWNGRLVHDDVEVAKPTGAAAPAENPDRPIQLGALRLQDHASDADGPVRYRNIWIAPLDPNTTKPSPWTHLSGPALDNWLVRGGEATFRVENGEIVGESRPDSLNTFLVWPEPFADFELLLEVKQHAELNSGIQIRSAIDGGLTNRPGKLIGYQVELDPSPRAFTAGIYDEARRGWLYPLIDSPSARSAYRPGDWNALRIVARGPVIRTWLNGVPAADIFDATDASGHVALQVHGVGDRKDPLQVRFRNVRIRRLE